MAHVTLLQFHRVSRIGLPSDNISQMPAGGDLRCKASRTARKRLDHFRCGPGFGGLVA